MANPHGKTGKVVFGDSGVVAKVTNWTRSTKGDLVENGGMEDGDDKQFIPGRRETSFEVQGNYDASDTDGQEVAVALAAVSFKFYPEGDATGKKYYAGSGYIESVGTTVPLDGKVTFSITVKQSGAGTRPTVA